MSRIHVTIDRLALPDVSPAERKALVEALETELRGLLAERATRRSWATSRRTPVLGLATMPLEPGAAGSRRFGVSLARAIGKGLEP